jgi:hypothetical protein
MSQLQQIEDNGYAAYYDGANRDENTYPYGSLEWNAWNSGFDRAKQEDDDAAAA